jgi:hemolysin III
MEPAPKGLARYLREPVNSLTHFVGILLSIAGLIVLLLLSRGEPWRTVSFAIYGGALILLYTASTLLHSLRVGAKAERRLRIFDHAAIFVLIAGSYTPIALVTLQQGRERWGWGILVAVWLIALCGVFFKLFWLEAPRWLSTALYLFMGWLAVVAIVPIAATLPAWGVFWLALGGFFYSVGAIIYGLKKPVLFPGVFGYHELWHLFVLAGSACHFVMMLFYVLPLPL